MKTVKINIKKSKWEKLEKISRKIGKYQGYEKINPETIIDHLIEEYLNIVKRITPGNTLTQLTP